MIRRSPARSNWSSPSITTVICSSSWVWTGAAVLGLYRTKLAMSWLPTTGRNTRPGTNSTAETSLSTSTYAPPVAPSPILGSIAKYRSASVIAARLPYGSSEESRQPAHPLGDHFVVDPAEGQPEIVSAPAIREEGDPRDESYPLGHRLLGELRGIDAVGQGQPT